MDTKSAIVAYKDAYERVHGRRPIVLFKKHCLTCSPLGTYFVKRPLVASFDPGFSPKQFRQAIEDLEIVSFLNKEIAA